jgi:osomolarity two-component system sensor histidine kinase NIK1
MGGDLWVRSEYGQGSQFYFTVKSKRAPWHGEQVRGRMTKSFPGRRILYIDTLGADHKPIVEGIVDSVEETGLDITVVKSIDEACAQQSSSGIFDTVLVDQLRIVQVLRDIEHLRYIPIVLVAPVVPQLNLKHCLDFGVANCIEPPMEAIDIANALTPALETSNRNLSDSNGEFVLNVLLAEDSELRLLASILSALMPRQTSSTRRSPSRCSRAPVTVSRLSRTGPSASRRSRRSYTTCVPPPLLELCSHSPHSGHPYGRLDAVHVRTVPAFRVPTLTSVRRGGIEATSIIRKYEDRRSLERVPIIALTAHAMLGDRERCVRLRGSSDHLAPLRTFLDRCGDG